MTWYKWHVTCSYSQVISWDRIIRFESYTHIPQIHLEHRVSWECLRGNCREQGGQKVSYSIVTGNSFECRTRNCLFYIYLDHKMFSEDRISMGFTYNRQEKSFMFTHVTETCSEQRSRKLAVFFTESWNTWLLIVFTWPVWIHDILAGIPV